MIGRLRFLLDRPLDPLAARAVVVLATAILLGFGALFVLGASEPSHSEVHHQQAPPAKYARAQLRPVLPDRPVHVGSVPQAGAYRPRQDPQDEENTSAAKSAAETLQSHRALQHIPYHQGGVSIRLTGARGDRAVLRVSASTARGARRGWHRYLHRYRDSGRAYIPIFDIRGSRNG